MGRLEYSFAGKEKPLCLGVHPKLGWKEAHHARDNARRFRDQQFDPGMLRKASQRAA